jgi:hypothetical protein
MNTKKNKLDFVPKEIRRYFGFLFDRGYKIKDFESHPQHFGNWRVALESTECVIEIYCDRNEISLAFGPLDIKEKTRIGLKSMICFLSQGKNVVKPYEGNLFWGKRKQFEILASLLKEYIDRITPFFGRDFQKHKFDLMFAQSKYSFLLLDKQSQNKNS